MKSAKDTFRKNREKGNTSVKEEESNLEREKKKHESELFGISHEEEAQSQEGTKKPSEGKGKKKVPEGMRRLHLLIHSDLHIRLKQFTVLNYEDIELSTIRGTIEAALDEYLKKRGF